MNHTVVFGISSGIAAYKIIDLAHNLRKKELEVIVTMTPHASQMIDPAEFVKATRHKVYTDLYPSDFDYHDVLEKREVEHIQIADAASLLVIAPATANIIAKLAYGIADDFVTTMALATTAPILLCPSMNVHMWEHETVQKNLAVLRRRGCIVMDPDRGSLACGYEGVGRLSDIGKIEKEILHLLKVRDQLKGKKVLVTAGGTSEAIDVVRMITNKSTGKMGVALAEECARRGADVLLLKSKSAIPSSVKEEFFESASELSKLVQKYIKDADIFFHTAAVADFAPHRIDEKIDSSEKISLELIPTEKISDKVKEWNPDVYFVSFKAEYRLSEKELVRKASEKMKQCHADAIVANDVGQEGAGFGSDTNEVFIIQTSEKTMHIKKDTKKNIAGKIIDILLVH